MPATHAYSYSTMAEKVVEVNNKTNSNHNVSQKNAFLAEVQRYDCVYNKGSKDFKNKYMKINCWANIGEAFGMTAAAAEANLIIFVQHILDF